MSNASDEPTEGMMATAQEIAPRDKKELVSKEEQTASGRYYVPYADIYETDGALTAAMEMPGVEKQHLTVSLENGVLRGDGQIEFSKYEGMQPVYTECNVGHFTRSSTLSNKVGPGAHQRSGGGWRADADATEGERKAQPRKITIHKLVASPSPG